MSKTKISRWWSVVSLVVALSMVLAACAPAATPTPPSAAEGPVVNSNGVVLPDDAAPIEQQVFLSAGLEGKHFDATKNIYETSGMSGYSLEPLVWLDYDFNAYPGAADSWEVSDDGLTWTFHLRENAMWSDGVPVTADDWVFSLRRMFSPETASPYVWFWGSIVNATAVSKGEVDISELGVAKVDDYTLAITTSQPIPYFLLLMGFIASIVPQHVVEEVGDDFASSPETYPSNGPYMLSEWNKGQNVVWVLNPYYDGPNAGKMEKIIYTFVAPSTPNSVLLSMYQAGELSSTGLAGAALQQALADPSMEGQMDLYALPNIFYMFFNTDEPPFDDLKVRQAISHAIDREAISEQVMQGLEVPAYSLLPPSIPCSQANDPEIQAIQAYDPELARQLLAEAGFPGGEGFPTIELWTRNGQIVVEAEAIQNMLRENLGITVIPTDQERSFYMDKLRAHEITMGLIQWAQDYSDPTNFMDWWVTQARHTWKNERFNELVNEARSVIDLENRCALYNEAERILIEDVGSVFIGNPIAADAWKPTVSGVRVSELDARVHYQKQFGDIYISEE